MQAQDYQQALDFFNQGLEMQPDSKVLLFGKARATYELGNYEEALEMFQSFIAKADAERATYKDEIYDAKFYSDKCREQLGMPVEQNEDAIPPPPMGE